MICKNCSFSIEAPLNFCPSCGVSLKEEPPVVAPSVVSGRRKMPVWFQLLTGLALIALVAVTAGILFTEKFVDVVDHQLEALQEGKIEEAYQSYTSKDFQNTTSFEEFKRFVERYPFFLHNHSASFPKRTLEQSLGFSETLTRGLIRGTLTSEDRVQTAVEYRLIKENNKWKILSIRLLKPYEVTIGKRKKIDKLPVSSS